MKKTVLLSLFASLIMTVAVWGANVPETVNIGLNSSSLSFEVELSAKDGVYTTSAFACPNEITEPLEEEALSEEYPDEEGEAELEEEEYSEELPEEILEEESEESGADDGGFYYLGDKITVTLSDGGTLICNGVETGEARVDFYSGSEFITCRKKEYRGYITLIAKPSGILIVNRVGLDHYLYGVVGREMSEGFPLEALKAQAVAARNYAIVKQGRHQSEGFDLCNGVHCQAYGGVSSEGETVRQAVDETSGKVLLYKGEVVECYYFSSDGGHTENSENVWVSSLGYLKGKPDLFENEDEIPGYSWSVTFTAEQIEEALKLRGADIGEITDVEISEYTKNGYAKKMIITGTKGERVYSKDNIRAALPSQLKSNNFTLKKGGQEVLVKVLTGNGKENVTIPKSTVLSVNGITTLGGGNEGEYTFSGKGNGHGVGMSQYGAKGMADLGYTYEEILEYYYTDTEISD